MIKFTPKFKKADIRKLLLTRKQRILDAVLLNLQRIGEEFVINARNTDTYKDRTGNLRGSIGYVILFDGKQMSADLDGTIDGITFARQAIVEVRKNYPQGFALIGVAGMDYAAAVESKGFDVITSSSQVAEENLKVAVKRISQKSKTI